MHENKKELNEVKRLGRNANACAFVVSCDVVFSDYYPPFSTKEFTSQKLTRSYIIINWQTQNMNFILSILKPVLFP